MTRLHKYSEDFIERIKSNEMMKDIEFVSFYNGKKQNSPILSPVVATGIKNTEMKNELFGDVISKNSYGTFVKTDVIFRIYLPYKEGGDNLTKLVGDLAFAVKESDFDNAVTETEYSEIGYDSDLKAVFRDISCTLEFCMYGGDENEC
ncbi:MAG: hypothetical protein ACI4QE_00840 [Acutalibacteraceae bacterium]